MLPARTARRLTAVAGLIRDEDIAVVRERARIDEVVSDYVTLKHAGGGSQKGLCPFHDEKSPSFNVNPSRGFFHCLAGETEVDDLGGSSPDVDLAGGVHTDPERAWPGGSRRPSHGRGVHDALGAQSRSR